MVRKEEGRDQDLPADVLWASEDVLRAGRTQAFQGTQEVKTVCTLTSMRGTYRVFQAISWPRKLSAGRLRARKNMFKAIGVEDNSRSQYLGQQKEELDVGQNKIGTIRRFYT